MTSRHVISRGGGQASVCLQHGSESEYEAWDVTGYFESLQEKQSKERYLEKLKSIEGQDPYEISRKEWIDDVDCWPDVTYINVGMYLLFAASPYTQEQLMNYKTHCWCSCDLLAYPGAFQAVDSSRQYLPSSFSFCRGQCKIMRTR